MAEVLNIALIGCGEHSREVLVPSLAMLSGINVLGVCDIDKAAATNAARILGVRRVEDEFAKVLTLDGLQAVVVAATPQVHYQVARQALARGVHVFVEKPPTVTTGELADLTRLAKRAGLVTCVGHNLRHTSAALEMRKLLNGGRLEPNASQDFGRLVAMEMRYLASKPRGTRWGLKSTLRSFLLSHANHAIDFMVYQMGRIQRVNAAVAKTDGDGVVLSAQFIFESGAVGNLLATSLAPHFAVSGSVVSETGRVVELNALNEITGYGFDGDEKRWGRCWTGRTLVSGFEAAGYSTELAAFVSAAGGDKSVKCGPGFAEELDVYETMDAIERIVAGKRK